MDVLSVVASVAGIISLGIQVTQSLVNIYSAYKTQKSDGIHIFEKLERLLGVLEILRSQLANRRFRTGERDLLKRFERSIQACEEYIQELQCETEKLKGKPTNDVRATARTAAYKVAYPFRQSTLKKLDESIDEIISHLLLALQVLQQKDINSVQDDIEDTKALLDLVRADQVSSTIREWLKAPDATVNYNEACKKWHPGTGLWFIKGSSFSSWLITPQSFLWLNGFAGCGKSVLCSTAIRYIYRHRRSNPRIGIAFFFFTFNDDSKQNTSAMLRALVLQLSNQLNDSHRLLSHLHDSFQNAMPPDQALMDCLHQLVRAFDNVYIILDGLDESPRHRPRRDLLQALVNLWAWSEPGLHLLATSRDEIDIREVFRDAFRLLPENIVSMKNDLINNDIAFFISDHLKASRILQRWVKYHHQIEKALIERADGVFRWVECQFIALESRPRSKRQLDALLASLPRDLDKTYERMLSSIDEESVGDARRILTLLCCAKRPLTVPELIDGVAVELGDDPRLNLDGRLLDHDEICRVCPGLIEADSNHYDQTTVRIAHFSVQEYLESGRAAATFRVRKPEAHAEIASICLTYLLEPSLTPSGSTISYPLAHYAAKYWHEHYHDGDKTIYQVEFRALQLFRSTGGAFETWVDIWNVDYADGKKPKKAPAPIYYASRLGLYSILSELVDETHSRGTFLGLNSSEVSNLVNAQGGFFGNALQAASSQGYKAAVQLLLEKGVNINAQGGFFGNALQAASYGGNEAVVQLLLKKGANINAQGGSFRNALLSAACGGHEAVVHLLLDNGADVT